MATLAQVRQRIDTWVSDRWPTIVARQENFRTNRGHYWQGLITHSTIPTFTNGTDGDSVADRLSANLTDQFENWSTVFPEWVTELLPCALRVDVYDGPSGQGWTVTVNVIYNGTLYQRTVNVGPQTQRAEGWHAVVPE